MKRFVAVYDEAAVRDTQICKEDPNLSLIHISEPTRRS